MAIQSYAPNGDVLQMTDSVMGSWTYSYDDFNRLVSGNATAGVDNGLDLGWTYDRYGNRWAQNATGTGTAGATQPQLTFTGNNNRVDGWVYDDAGNLLNDGRNSYAYDAEGRLVSLNGQPTYVYDAEGRRIAKYSGSSISAAYLLDLAGNQVTELTGSGGWKHSNIWAGHLLATYEGPYGTASAGYHFHLTDWLGTERMQTTATGSNEEVCYSYPFGDGLNCTGTSADATEHHFTGKERDTESGLDYFFARYYSSGLARFMTPDWAAAPAAVPYARFGDPRSLNLYAYVGNNPITGIDPDGHCGSDDATCLQEEEENESWQNEAFGGVLADQFGYASGEAAASGLGASNSPCQGCPPQPPESVIVSGDDPGGVTFTGELARSIIQSLLGALAGQPAVFAPVSYSKAHGKGERNRAGKASGTPNEEKVNRKARYDPKTKRWWEPDQNGKRKDLGPSFHPTPEQLKKAGVAMTGVAGTAAAGATIWEILEAGAAGALAF
ncbi:MAG: RHS repeat domain-containing protein [Acidobacteriota bacterium]